MASDFRSLGLSEWLVKCLNNLDVVKPSAIQREAIPKILERQPIHPGTSWSSHLSSRARDVFACAPTGTGKTLAYILPILERVVRDPRPYFALILVPTRELAYQISEVIKVLSGASKGGAVCMVKSLLLIGGGNNGLQTTRSEAQGLWFGKPNIIIATPGRLIEHILNKNFLEFSGAHRRISFEMLVLDEADQLISGDFCHQVKTIIDWVDGRSDAEDEQQQSISNKPKRQTLVFSATLTTALEVLRDLVMSKDPNNQPAVINLLPSIDQMKSEIATNPNLDQRYLLCPETVKLAYLIESILDLDFKQAIVFCETKRKAKMIHMVMVELGFNGSGFNLHPVLLNADLSQKERFAALEKFRSLRSRILVTTDVANRGLDLPQVDLVINYSCPPSPVSYVHRVGRTCRRIDFKRESLLTNVYAKDNDNQEDAEEGDRTEEQNRERHLRRKGQDSLVSKKYEGKALTIITQYDIKLLKAVEEFIGLKLEAEDEVDEENVTKILRQVALAAKDAEVKMDEDDHTGDNTNINKLMKLNRLKQKMDHKEKRDKRKMLKMKKQIKKGKRRK